MRSLQFSAKTLQFSKRFALGSPRGALLNRNGAAGGAAPRRSEPQGNHAASAPKAARGSRPSRPAARKAAARDTKLQDAGSRQFQGAIRKTNAPRGDGRKLDAETAELTSFPPYARVATRGRAPSRLRVSSSLRRSACRASGSARRSDRRRRRRSSRSARARRSGSRLPV